MNYIILNINQVDNVDFSQIAETSKDTIRKSIDGTEFTAKWIGAMPDTISSIPESDRSAILTHAEALTLLATAEWSDPNPPV